MFRKGSKIVARQSSNLSSLDSDLSLSSFPHCGSIIQDKNSSLSSSGKAVHHATKSGASGVEIIRFGAEAEFEIVIGVAEDTKSPGAIWIGVRVTQVTFDPGVNSMAWYISLVSVMTGSPTPGKG
jgi:hypothetical protein